MADYSAPSKIIFLFDADNTLLDNDRIIADLNEYLVREVGLDRAQSYWRIFDDLWDRLGYPDYFGALQQFRTEYPYTFSLIEASSFLIDYPYADRVYPDALAVIEHVKRWGPAVILSDGDAVLQPRKVERAGLSKAVNGRVLISVHKELELDVVLQRFPAEHYIMVDDKLRILAAIKKIWGPRVTTVFVRQGHYALDPMITSEDPNADVTIGQIGDLLKYDFQSIQIFEQTSSMIKAKNHK
jgi:FMN phosphatase YigB (HAD superfamily)